ncbi:MAG: hypothetical protein Q7T82_11110 [Armatimonadota bacterium]|nr:hypothetical protein [Armatimonadota bacterium]
MDVYKPRSLRNTGYAVYVQPGKELALHGIWLSGLIYIGHAYRPERRGPLIDRYSGSCSFRRTLGALLKEELGLTAVPSGRGRTNRDFVNYCFTFDSEMRLTRWIEENLDVAPEALGDDLGLGDKRGAIHSKEPVLCLAGWQNPHLAKLQALRRICADEARAAKAKGRTSKP